MQAVDGFGRDFDGGDEAEGQIGSVDVVVDGLGHADQRQTLNEELGGHGKGSFAAHANDGVDAVVRDGLSNTLDAVGHGERLHPRRTQHRAAARQDAAHALDIEAYPAVFDHAQPTVGEADDLVAIRALGFANNRSNDRVEAWAITTAGQHTDAHLVSFVSTPLPAPRGPVGTSHYARRLMVVITIDADTSGVRALAIDDEGQPIANAYRRQPTNCANASPTAETLVDDASDRGAPAPF